jgi:UDP-N-acetyl-2-amino-2-deoxyglucuronate dehydrogenase
MMSEHRVLLIGHGAISHRYLKAFEGLKNVEVVGVVGRNLDRASAYAKLQGIPSAYTDIRQAAEQAKATAVVICTPNAAHEEAVMTAAKLGLHCLCEKPLHIHPMKQLEMVRSCREQGVKLAVSYMRRFSTHIQLVKSLVERGSLGQIKVIDVTLKHYREPAYYSGWHGTYEIDGGGPFIQQGSHMIDLALWIGGDYQEVLSANLFQAVHEIETEDHGYAVIAYKSGAIGMIEASTACKGFGRESIEISGTKGTIALDFNGIKHFQVDGLEQPEFMDGDPSVDVLFRLLAEDFIHSIEEDTQPYVDGASALGAVELVHAIYQKAGKPVSLN